MSTTLLLIVGLCLVSIVMEFFSGISTLLLLLCFIIEYCSDISTSLLLIVELFLVSIVREFCSGMSTLILLIVEFCSGMSTLLLILERSFLEDLLLLIGGIVLDFSSSLSEFLLLLDGIFLEELLLMIVDIVIDFCSNTSTFFWGDKRFLLGILTILLLSEQILFLLGMLILML